MQGTTTKDTGPRRSQLTGLGAALLGLGTVVGVAVIHVAPTWWFLSDSYGGARVDAISWVIIGMMLTGSVLGLLGFDGS